MSKTTFKFPNTASCVVVFNRNGVNKEVVIPTPANDEALKNTLIMKHKVGFSEVRCIKADPNSVLLSTKIQHTRAGSLNDRWWLVNTLRGR
jgi:hypothetical protein